VGEQERRRRDEPSNYMVYESLSNEMKSGSSLSHLNLIFTQLIKGMETGWV
jgi:hypothetical protein